VCREFKLPTGFSSDDNFCRDAARSRWLQANHRSPFARLHNIVPEWAAAFASDPKGLKAKREWKLGRPSGHFWSKKDEGAWTILKDLILAVEKPLGAAGICRRDWTSTEGKSRSAWRSSPAGGKIDYIWAVEDDWDPSKLCSNTFQMEWLPKSGAAAFPELDRGASEDFEKASCIPRPTCGSVS
jgi:predicted NUDIX family NTP pyrophosphohydrolase